MTKTRRTTMTILEDVISNVSSYMAVNKVLIDRLLSIVEEQQKALTSLQKVVSEHKERARKKKHYQQVKKASANYYTKTEDSPPYLLTKDNHPANQSRVTPLVKDVQSLKEDKKSIPPQEEKFFKELDF